MLVPETNLSSASRSGARSFLASRAPRKAAYAAFRKASRMTFANAQQTQQEIRGSVVDGTCPVALPVLTQTLKSRPCNNQSTS